MLGYGPPYYGSARTIFGASFIASYEATAGITVATGVSAWADLSGNGRTLSQATGGAQPAFAANGGPNGLPCVTGDGVDDSLSNNWVPPAPGTSPFAYIAVVKLISGTINKRLLGGQASTRACVT